MTKKRKVKYPRALHSTPARIAELITDTGLREVECRYWTMEFPQSTYVKGWMAAHQKQ